MYKLLLSWRYLCTRYIALASIVSVTLGVATLIIVNAVMGSISNVLEQYLKYSLPNYQEITIHALAKSMKKTSDDRVVLANAHFHLEGTTIDGNILLILEIGSMDALLEGITRMTPSD